MCFPDKFSESGILNYYSQVRDRMVYQLRMLYEPSGNLKNKIEGIDGYLLDLMVPQNLDGNSTHNILIQQKVSFEKVTVALMQNGINEPDGLTVLRFYSALEYYEKQNKSNN